VGAANGLISEGAHFSGLRVMRQLTLLSRPGEGRATLKT